MVYKTLILPTLLQEKWLVEEYKVKINISFAGMLSRYGFEFEKSNPGWSGIVSDNPNKIGYNALSKPSNYTNNGLVYVNSGTLGQSGKVGWVWSNTSISTSFSYVSSTHIDMVAPSEFEDSMYGFSLRH